MIWISGRFAQADVTTTKKETPDSLVLCPLLDAIKGHQHVRIMVTVGLRLAIIFTKQV